MRGPLERAGRFWPLVCILPVASLLLFAGDFYFPRGADYTDMAITHFPNAIWIQRAFHSWGELPLWSPAILSGYPFMANPLSGLFYPPGWLALVFPQPFGLNLLMVLHLVLGGVGMYWFLRSEGIGQLPAVFGAIAFEGMPKLVAHAAAGHVTLVYAVAWTPWLLRAERQGRSAWWKAGMIFALILLADLRWAAMAGIFWVAFALRIFPSSGVFNLKRLGWRVGLGMGTVVMAALLTAVLLLPVSEYASLSTRAWMTVQDSLTLSLPPLQLLGLAAPSPGMSAEWVLYPGGAVLVLAILGLGLPTYRRRSAFWWAVAIVGLLFSLGSYFPGMEFVMGLPGLSLLRVPPRALILVVFGWIVVAAWTLQSLIEDDQLLRKMSRFNPLLFLVALTMVDLALAVLGWVVTGKIPPGFLLGGAALAGSLGLIFLQRAGKLSAHALVLFSSVWLLVDLCVTNTSGIDFRPAMQVLSQGAAAAQYLASQPGQFRVYSPSYSLPQQTAASYGLELADGVDPLQLRSYVQYMADASGVAQSGYSVTLPPFANGETSRDNRSAHPNARMLGLLNIGYVVAEFDLNEPGLVEAAQFGQTRVYRNQVGLSRAWVQDPSAPLGQGILHEAVLTATANTIQVEAEGPGLLVIAEIAYPGWITRLDGQVISGGASSDLLRTIVLAPGSHRVTAQFLPTRLLVGGILSITAWLLLGGLGLFGLWRRS